MDFRSQMSAIAALYCPVNHSFSSRLLKLSLLVFNGDPLEWLSLWDSFHVRVNSKPGLPEIDKINYLKAQVTGEAERAILVPVVTMLELSPPSRTDFGNPTRLPTQIWRPCWTYHTQPATKPCSLRSVILAKLWEKTKSNLARSQQGDYGTIQDLREALKQELKVLEAGTTPLLDPTPTALFLTARQCWPSFQFRCRNRGGKHHTTMPSVRKTTTPPPGTKEILSPGNTSEYVHATFTPTQMGYKYPILLKTAVSQVKVGNLSREANILSTWWGCTTFFQNWRFGRWTRRKTRFQTKHLIHCWFSMERGTPPLPTNLTICEKRTRALTRRLTRTPSCWNATVISSRNRKHEALSRRSTAQTHLIVYTTFLITLWKRNHRPRPFALCLIAAVTRTLPKIRPQLMECLTRQYYANVLGLRWDTASDTLTLASKDVFPQLRTPSSLSVRF